MKYLFTTVLLITAFSISAQEYYLLVGTYNSPKSEGVYVYRFNSTNGNATEISHVKTSNPSFLAISPDEKLVYAVHEDADNNGKGGEVASFSFDKSKGMLTFINKQSSGGDHPCYVAVDKTGKWVFAGNYTSGSLSMLKANKDGHLDPASTVIQHEGYSVNSERQNSPHVHCTVLSPDNKYLYVADLGIDKIMTYAFNAKKGTLSNSRAGYIMTEPGSGPRHIAIHPNGRFVYLIEELTGSIVAYKDFGNADLQELQTISALPPAYDGPVGSADIHVSPDGKFVYASNRGESNTIGIFKVNKETGTLMPVSHISTLGKKPRNFNFDPTGSYLLVGNQDSDEIVIFKRDKETGLLTDSGKRISVGKPVCIKWISTK
ncbi:MAG TPA: lactonase family protein [Chitinophagaceae bacterium]|nr:lactonase family protein [Chitinophagaceae bacterium]